jgi:hypothetical protein
MKFINILIDEEDHNGYGFFCDIDDTSPIQHIKNPMPKYDEYTNDKEDKDKKRAIHDNILSNHPVSFFITCVMNEPVKYAMICIASSMTAIAIYSIMNVTNN